MRERASSVRLADCLAPRVCVFHTGALGDHVLIWPLLRLLVREDATRELVLITHASHGRLAAGVLGAGLSSPSRFRTECIESPRFSRLWNTHVQIESERASIDVVLSFLADEHSSAGRVWFSNARASFPAARVIALAGPALSVHAEFWREVRAHALSCVERKHNPAGPIVLFTGAGGEQKRWPMRCWQRVHDEIRSRFSGADVLVLAGPVEAERLSTDERTIFSAIGGRICVDLLELARDIARSRAFIGADTGPTHLAAQLGVPTLALFGPTDPGVWSPVGPAVGILSPQSQRLDQKNPMLWLFPEVVFNELERMIQA